MATVTRGQLSAKTSSTSPAGSVSLKGSVPPKSKKQRYECPICCILFRMRLERKKDRILFFVMVFVPRGYTVVVLGCPGQLFWWS